MKWSMKRLTTTTLLQGQWDVHTSNSRSYVVEINGDKGEYYGVGGDKFSSGMISTVVVDGAAYSWKWFNNHFKDNGTMTGQFTSVDTACGIITPYNYEWRMERRPTDGNPKNADANPHYVLSAEDWSVSPDQLKEFLEEVEKRWTDEDPNGYTVCNQFIKPATADAAVSYALLKNPSGLKSKHFATHAWAENIKEFCKNVVEVIDGPIWICFLANPQTWAPVELSALLGNEPKESPFAKALKTASSTIVVRNTNVCLYVRLWCVYELFLTHELNREITVVGKSPNDIDRSKLGYNAGASTEEDTMMLRGVIEEKRDFVDKWIADIIGD